MAGHHHHHHHHQHHQQNHPTNCCSSSISHGCSFNCDSICNQTFHCHSPPLPSADPLLETLAARKLYAQSRQFHGLQNPNDRFPHPQQRRGKRQEDQRSTDLLISSLVSRIEALEASLGRFPPSRDFESCDRRRRSLREVAARVIQTHFRAFLVRRSRTLGQLRDLAIVKTSFTSLRSSISLESDVDLYGVARKGVDLLVKLDSILGDDSMVRDGKMSISRDLVRFLEFVEGVSVKRHELYLKARKNNVRLGQNGDKRRVVVNRNCSDLDSDSDSIRRELTVKLKNSVEKIRGHTRFCRNDDEDVVLEGFQHVSDDDYDEEAEEEEEENPDVVIMEKSGPTKNGVSAKKKSVSFAENRNVLKLFSVNTDEPVLNEDGTNGSDGDSTTSSEDRSQDVDEIKLFPLGTEDDGDKVVTVVNKALARRPGNGPRREGVYEIRGRYDDQDDDFFFSAPLPVQMEEKADSVKRRNAVKILR